jgi:SSS family solute:Na+ symporter
MSIAAANTFTRNIYKEWLKKNATPAEEARVSKITSLLVKGIALLFVLTLDNQNAINFQLLGGIWILQTFPSIVFSLYTRWFHRWALLAGWAAGMVFGTISAYRVINPLTGKHFGGSLAEIPGLGDLGYIAMTAFALNILVAIVLTVVLNAMKVSNGADTTEPGDYYADTDDVRVQADLANEDMLTKGEPKAR